MTRILAVTNWYPPHHTGGYEIVCRDVLTRLAERGHRVEVLCSDEGPADDVAAGEGRVGVRRHLRTYWRDGQPWVTSLADQLEVERHNQAVLAHALDDAMPDVVSVWQMAALSLGLLASVATRRIPMVYAVCDDWPIYAVDLDPWARRWQADPFRRTAGRLLSLVTGLPTVVPDLGKAGVACVVSEFTGTAVRRGSPWYFPVSPVVRNGIDRSALGATLHHDPASVEQRPWEWKLAYFGRFDPRKGTDTLLRAMPLLPARASLAMYGRGGGTERERLEALAAELGVADRVTFGALEREELARAYAAADCVVFPSEWPEPSGLVPLEAMDCGTPVVATGVGGSAEFLADGRNCVLFRPGDAGDLARAVTRVAGDAELRARLRREGRLTARAFDIERMADGYETWLTAAASGDVAGAAGRWSSGSPVTDPGLATGVGEILARHQARTETVLREEPAGVVDEGDVKRLYSELGEGWWQLHTEGGEPIPVLSAPETAPVVLSRFAGLHGLVLDAGCGPSPAVAVGLDLQGDKTVVAMDIGLGTVRVAREIAAREKAVLLGVVGDVERLPFRSGAFSGVVCDDTIEHLPDDRAGAAELARILGADGRAVIATPNRHSAVVLIQRARDRWHGVRRPPAAYFVSNSHLREYTWRQLVDLVEQSFEVTARLPVGWQAGPRRRLLTRLLRGPGQEFSQMIVLEGRPRRS